MQDTINSEKFKENNV